MTIKKSFLINITAFFSTIPFAAPIPISSDVQYPVFLLAGLIFIWDAVTKKINLNLFEIFFIFFAFLSFFYISPFAEFEYSLFKRVGILFGFFIFYFFSRYWKDINPNYILFGIFLNLTAALIHFMLPEFWISYGQSFVRSIVLSEIMGSRGISGLSAEPSFLGGICIYLIIITYVLLQEKRISLNVFYLSSISNLLMLYLSKSGLSVFMFLFMITVLFFLSNISLLRKIIVVSSGFSLLYLFTFVIELDSRGFTLLRILFQNPEYFFFVDESVGMRIISLLVGFQSIAQGEIFGHGAGSLPFVAPDIIEKAGLGDTFGEFVISVSGGIWSSLGQYTTEFGLIFLFFILYAFLHTNGSKLNYFVRSNIFLFMLGTFSILFPPLWACLGITDKRNRNTDQNNY
jgi:hypothetical protein